MTDPNIDTKVKIMQVARVFFAEKGFEGTSIRDIAKAADVNVASVNYHFNNKENLFAELLRMGYNECSENMKDFYQKSDPSVEEMLVHLFYYFLDKSHDLRAHFKMMMSSQHSPKMVLESEGSDYVGPPGGEFVIAAIQKEVGQAFSEKDLHWALKSLFSHVVHTCIMYDCCFKTNDIPYSSVEDLEENIRRLSQVVINDLKSLKK